LEALKLLAPKMHKAEGSEMHKALLAIDGSDYSRRAVDFLVTHIRGIGPVEVVLLNVQPPPETRALAKHRDAVLAELRQCGERVLAEPRRQLDAVGIPYQARIEFGNIGRSIVEVANKEGCAQIIMGTQGRSALADLLLGSVATNVLRLTGVPVTLVK
jgi:nucleotide-binding universal stress UspA family protein